MGQACAKTLYCGLIGELVEGFRQAEAELAFDPYVLLGPMCYWERVGTRNDSATMCLRRLLGRRRLG